jgi:hypothetical protein
MAIAATHAIGCRRNRVPAHGSQLKWLLSYNGMHYECSRQAGQMVGGDRHMYVREYPDIGSWRLKFA